VKTRIASLLADRRPLAAAGRASARASQGTGMSSTERNTETVTHHAKAKTTGSTSGIGNSRGLFSGAFAFALIVAALLVLPWSAQAAASQHPFLGAFCEGEPTGIGTPPCEPEFGEPEGMAVDQSTGDLLVIDASAGTVSRYHEDGTPANFSALGTNAIDGEGSGPPCTPPSDQCDGTPENGLSFGSAYEVQVAVDNSGGATDGDIYVTSAGLIDIFSSEGEYLGQLTASSEGGFGDACGVAVDPDGDVYVGDYENPVTGEGGVHVFDPAANPPVEADNTANFATPFPCTLAAGAGPSAGYIFVAAFDEEVTKLDATTGAEEYVVSPGQNTTVSVDPASGHVFVATGEEVKEFDASGASSATEVSAIAPAEGAFNGVAVNEETGNVYVTREGSSQVEVYGPLPPPGHPFLGAFCEGEPTGIGTPPCEPEFGEPEGMAVDQSTGDLLVIDASAGTVSRYHEDGTPANFSALGTNAIDGEGSGPPCTPPSDQCDGTPENGLSFGSAYEVQVAVDNSGGATDGDIYVTSAGLIDIFSSEGEYLGQLTASSEGGFGDACGVAVDPDGDVYVGDYENPVTGEGGVHVFDPAANPPVEADNTANFATPFPCTLAAGAGPSAGYIFVAAFDEEVTKLDATTGAEEYVVSPGQNTTVSVDPASGHVFVATGEEVKEFDASGASSATEVSAIAPAEGAFNGVAVNEETGNVYVTREGSSQVEVYGPLTNGEQKFKFKVIKDGNGSGSVECEVDGGPAEPCPETNTEYLEGTEIVLTATEGAHSVFAGFSSGGCSTTSPCTLTLEANTTVTATFNQTPPSVENNPEGTVTSTTAVLNGHVDNEGDPAGSTCSFEVTLATDTGFAAPVKAQFCVPTPVSGSANTAVTATATGLNPATDYIYRVLATNSGGTSEAAPPEPFTTPVGPPLISAEPASVVTGTTATLNASVNPAGLATGYHFEWGLSGTSPYEHRVPAEGELSAGPGSSPVPVSTDLTGLEPGTTYHFRLVATNSAGETKGADVEFEARQTLDSQGLPDNRRFELVSPPDKRPQGAVTAQLTQYMVSSQAAEDGQSVVFPLLGGLENTDAGGDSSYLAKRSSSGWQSTKISPPSLVPAPTNGVLGNATPGLVEYASRDLSCAVINTFNPLTADTPVADVELGVYNLYRRNPDGSYTLITNTVPANPEIEPVESRGFPVGIVAGASSDCSRIYFQSSYQYLPGASSSLYEWDEGTLRDAGRLPSGAIPHVRGPLNEFLIGSGGEIGANNPRRSNSVSADGLHFFFTALSDEEATSGKMAIFVREGNHAVAEASKRQGGAKDSLGATYQTASPDGSHVFFTASYGLTPSSSSGPAEDCSSHGTLKACDLYDYNVDTGGLTDLSADPNAADTNGAAVAGVLGVSDDGSAVYFAALGQLAAGQGKTYAENTSGSGSANVYLARGGQLTYVATIAGTSAASEVTPDGEHLLFDSSANITGYVSGGVQEAYLYSAQTGSTVCVSCSDQPSVGDSLTSPLISNLPNSPSRQIHVRQMSDAGSRVFFYSPDVLAPGAVSGELNIYEWERGQVYFLQVSGPPHGFLEVDFKSVELYGASNSGDDVFFSTPKQLDSHDTDFVKDAYDARVDGGFPPPTTPPPPCQSDESVALLPGQTYCQGAPTSPPGASTPSSEGFSGSGNPRTTRDCRRFARQARQLGLRAMRLRHMAARSSNAGRAKRLRQKADRFGAGAKKRSLVAKRCRRADRRAAK
jgi:hypothetical protein